MPGYAEALLRGSSSAVLFGNPMAIIESHFPSETLLSIEQLLSSDSPQNQIKGLNLLRKERNYHLISMVMERMYSVDAEVAGLARNVAIQLAETCVKDHDKTIGRLDLLNSAIIIRKYHPEFIQESLQKLQSDDIETIIDAIHSVKHFINEDQAIAIVNRFLQHPNEKVRATVCLHMGLAVSGKNASLLAKFLEDSDKRVRANVLEYMEQSKDSRFLGTFLKYRYDKNSRIRANALKGLHSLGEEKIQYDLEGMLKNESPAMRASAVWLIGEIGKVDKKFLKLLKRVANDPDEKVREHLVLVLNKIGAIRQLKFLRKKLKKICPHQMASSYFEPREKKKGFFLFRWFGQG